MCTKKFIPCRNCPNRTKGGPRPGYYYDRVNGYDIVVECDCHKKWREASELDRKYEFSQVSTDYTFDDYRGTKSKEDLEALKMIPENFPKFAYKKMIYLYGPNGTQKTSMVQCMGKELIKKGYTVQYTLMNTLINSLMVDFDDPNEESKQAFVKRCGEVDLLIIDESFDLSKTTIYKSGFQIPNLDAFIRNRFEMNKKSILFVSNKKPNEIKDQRFGASLENLIVRNTKESFLEFMDVYIDNVGTPDPKGLFRK